MSAAARLATALTLSLVLHGALLATMYRLPIGAQLGFGAPGKPWAADLQARLRSAEREAGPSRLDFRTDVPPVAPRFAEPVVPPVPHSDVKPVAALPALGWIAPPRYLPASELDEKPQIRTRHAPEFPPDARSDSGRVVLRLYINQSGGVDEIAVVSVEPEPAFEEPAVRAFADALFTPGRRQGVPVPSTVTIELLFGIALPALPFRPTEGPLFQPPRGRSAGGPPRRVNP